MIFSFNSDTVKRGAFAAIALGLGAGRRRGFEIVLLTFTTGFFLAGLLLAVTLRAAGLDCGAFAEAASVAGWSIAAVAASTSAISDFAGLAAAAAAA
jgi:hypothetical protein